MSKSVLKAADAEGQVIEHVPRVFEARMSAVAQTFMDSEVVRGSSFRMSPLLAKQTGIADVERQTLEERVEAMALEKVKEIQEKGYKEAHDLGLEEGREEANRNAAEEIQVRLDRLDQVLSEIEKIKSRLIGENEGHIMRIILELTKRLTFREIKNQEDRILPVLKEAIETAQSEEDVTVRLSPEDFDFLEAYKTQSGKEYQFVKKIKLEKTPEISPGGCIVETNYGSIDATIEERIGKLWGILVDKIPTPEEGA